MLLYVVLTLILSSTNAQNPLAKNEISQFQSSAVDYLLPRDVRPSLYQIELEPDFETETYSGSVNITLLTISTTNTVVFHTYELDINASTISLLDENGTSVNSISDTFYSNDDRQFYSIVFREDLLEGEEYVLVIGSFKGILNSDLNGFYLARYINEYGVTRKLATTDFEPTFARRAFPCWDEPALKAEFEITLIRTAEYNSVSNTPLASTIQISNDRFRDKFERTVKMSTYLVAFIVSDFTYIAEQNHRVFGRPVLVASGSGNFALEAGIKILDVIAEIVGVPYTLPKMDQFGLPSGYFSWGAMENWGLVTYRESYLFSGYRQSTAEIIAHEFGHQWFGNLVSPAWWSYIWLSEGFATYFEYYAASLILDDMDFIYEFVTESVQYVLFVDSMGITRPMNQDAGSPQDVDNLFDVIAYNKGGAIVRMIEGIMSTEVFRRGLNIYLDKMAFSAAEPEDLYSSLQLALEEANVDPLPQGENMSSVMSTWDSNAGYPLLTITRNYTDGSVTLSQRRFLMTDPNNNDRSIWYIPISYSTQSNIDFSDPTPRVWLTNRETTVDLYDLNSDDWIIANNHLSGFYRVNYDNENWYKIIDFLNSENSDQIDRVTRAQLIEDSYELANSGVINYAIYLGISQSLVRNVDYIPLNAFVKHLNFLDAQLSSTEVYGKFQVFVLELLQTAIKSVGLVEDENDSRFTKLNRMNILTWMCRYRNPDCEEYAIQSLRNWEQDGSKVIPSSLQVPLICTALKIGDQNDWEFVFQKFEDETDPEVRTKLLMGLGCSQDEVILKRFLNVILDTNNDLNPTDRLSVLSSVYNSGMYGETFIYNYVINNFATFKARFSSSELSSIAKGIVMNLSTTEQLNELAAFVRKINEESTFEDALKTLKSNVEWSEKYLQSVVRWFNTKY